MNQKRLPEFANPPVVETVVGVQFNTLAKFSNAHIGAFWKTLGPEWPHASDAALIKDQFERFEEGSWFESDFDFLFSKTPILRGQIQDKEKSRMIQVQNSRFHYNWLGHQGGDYPRFNQVLPEFERYWDCFRAYIEEEGIEKIIPNQWEITYVNHIPKGTLWQQADEWPKLFQLSCILPSLPDFINFESFKNEWHFEIVPQKGRLHINLQHGMKKHPEPCEILIVNLTARGPISKEDEDRQEAIFHGLNLGHEVIVKTFTKMTSSTAHDYWERKS